MRHFPPCLDGVGRGVGALVSKSEWRSPEERLRNTVLDVFKQIIGHDRSWGTTDRGGSLASVTAPSIDGCAHGLLRGKLFSKVGQGLSPGVPHLIDQRKGDPPLKCARQELPSVPQKSDLFAAHTLLGHFRLLTYL